MDCEMNEGEVKKLDERNGKECKETSGQSDHCNKCHMNFDAFDEFVGHKCQSSPFPCSLCPEKFDYDFQRNIHMKTMHGKAGGDATQSESGKSKNSLAEVIDCKVCKESSKQQNDSGRSEMEVDQEVNGTGASKDEGTRNRTSKRKTVVNPSDKTENLANLRKKARCASGSAKSGVYSGEKLSSKEGNEKSDDANLGTLIKALPDNEYAVLLQSDPANNSNYKCIKCCKVFRSFKLAASHYTSCKSKLQKNVSVPANVKWVCTHCNSLFIKIAEFLKHKRICSDISMQIGSVKKKLLATVNETKKSISCQPFNKECSKCHQICFLSCKNSSCQDLRKYMTSCIVSLRKLPFTDLDIQSGAYLYECVNCKIVFTDNRLYLKHMEGAHRISEVTQGKPLLFPPAYKALKQIKTEMPPPEPPQAPSAETVDTNAVLTLLEELKRNFPSCDPDASNNGDMTSGGFASCSQGAEGRKDNPLGMSPEPNFYTVFNLLLCKCNPRKSGDSPCVECMSSLRTTDVPPEIIHSIFTDLLGSTRVEAPNFGAFESTLETPPVSHTGFTPPPTPDSKSARADNPDPDVSMAFEPACSPISEENRTSPEDDDECMDELQIDPSPEQERDSAAEAPPPPEEETVKVVHVKNDLEFDAYVMVSPTDPNNIEKYVCSHCLSSHDVNSLPKHILNQHNLSRDVINARIMVNHPKKESSKEQ